MDIGAIMTGNVEDRQEALHHLIAVYLFTAGTHFSPRRSVRVRHVAVKTRGVWADVGNTMRPVRDIEDLDPEREAIEEQCQ
jgi:hypothetical protein